MRKRFFKTSNILLLLFLLFAFFTHFYKLGEYFNLTGDPGRDAVIIREIIVDKNLTLIGPKTSTGGFYYAPWYFYLLVPVFVIMGLDPIAGPIFTALAGVLTTYLIYRFGKKMYGETAGFMSGFLYSGSAFALTHDRYAWNPSLTPICGLLSFWFFYKFIEDKDWRNLVLWGLFFGLGIQFHFVLLFSLPVYIFWFLIRGIKVNQWGKGLLGAVLMISFFFLPILIFELRHEFMTSKSFIKFLSYGVERGKTYHPEMGILYYWQLIDDSLKAVVFRGEYLLVFLFIMGMVALSIEGNWRFLLPASLYFGSLLVLGFYKGPVHPYYWVGISVFVFFLIGYLLSEIAKISRGFSFLGLFLFLFLLTENLKEAPIWERPARTVKEEKEAAKIVAEDGKRFGKINLVMLSDIDAAHSAYEYRYLVEYYGKDVLDADKYHEAEKLYVIDEQGVKEVVDLPIMEIRNFRAKEIERRWRTKGGFIIYRLGK